jgi:signal transduction histidine kinase
VELVVADSGVGIDDQDLPRLFTRFTRVGDPLASAAIPGTGLGLYLSREAARLHGGDLTVRSRAGHGSEFTLRLPEAAPTP